MKTGIISVIVPQIQRLRVTIVLGFRLFKKFPGKLVEF